MNNYIKTKLRGIAAFNEDFLKYFTAWYICVILKAVISDSLDTRSEIK